MPFNVYPIGRLGDDDIGRSLYGEMENAGLDVRFVELVPGEKTMFSFCFIYPDGAGGNLTVEESACTKVDVECIGKATDVFSRHEGSFIALAAPEVPLGARKRLLELGRKHKGFNVASFTSGEMNAALDDNMFELVDLLAVNLDEAAALCDTVVDEKNTEAIVGRTVKKMLTYNPSMCLSITCGKGGSWSWDGHNLSFQPIFPVSEVKSSAGAGDAHIAGILAGLVSGLSLPQSQTLGTLAAAYSVTSPHTIHPGMSRQALLNFANHFEKVDTSILHVLAT
jgi:sugar/nucleoside kinase (ribokinase family)